MAEYTKEQKAYLLNNLQELRVRMVTRINDYYAGKISRLTSAEKIQLICEGSVKLLPDAQILANSCREPSLFSSFDFSTFERAEKMINVERDEVLCNFAKKCRILQSDIMFEKLTAESVLAKLNELERFAEPKQKLK